MLRNRPTTLGFVKPKKDPLFRMEVELDPYTDNLDQRCEHMNITFDGSVYNDQKMYVGKIAAAQWEYICQFDKPTEMKRTGYNRFVVDVCGEIDRSAIFLDPHDRPHIYKCGRLDHYPHMIPGTEYFCKIVPDGDVMDVYVGDETLLRCREKYNRIDQIKKWLEKGYQATAQIELHTESCSLFLILRKKK